MDESTLYNDSKHNLLNFTGPSSAGVSPLEQEVLDEYERLSRNMKEVSFSHHVFQPVFFFLQAPCPFRCLEREEQKRGGRKYLPRRMGWREEETNKKERHFAKVDTGVLPSSIPERLSDHAYVSEQLSSTLTDLSSGPITLEIAEGLRLLERKVASVYTLMKASVYSIVLQQGQLEGMDEGVGERMDDGGGEAGE
ncbi:hypothetical protein AYL99_08053 [Fonsecaea erecta]|uniref:DASH complex subunit DAD3 n=1 Tax=Fonsecaea erecta TaxID=1367422 RepID=A0A178ZE20_9EURO|nr:hypothetical protein AYL99_08053 [Fonsecaea erecta]OAP57315.1 hypothetical protein AYL99_08053 [Fonsecaea erecta]